MAQGSSSCQRVKQSSNQHDTLHRTHTLGTLYKKQFSSHQFYFDRPGYFFPVSQASSKWKQSLSVTPAILHTQTVRPSTPSILLFLCDALQLIWQHLLKVLLPFFLGINGFQYWLSLSLIPCPQFFYLALHLWVKVSKPSFQLLISKCPQLSMWDEIKKLKNERWS